MPRGVIALFLKLNLPDKSTIEEYFVFVMSTVKAILDVCCQKAPNAVIVFHGHSHATENIF